MDITFIRKFEEALSNLAVANGGNLASSANKAKLMFILHNTCAVHGRQEGARVDVTARCSENGINAISRRRWMKEE